MSIQLITKISQLTRFFENVTYLSKNPPLRVFNPFARSYLNQNQSLECIFRNQEKIKKKQYNQRVIEVEHGCFTPIVTSSFGGLGKETSAFVSRLVEKLAEKNVMETSIVSKIM